jgi:hypothetical protein
MTRIELALSLAAALACALPAIPAQAQANRTFVSAMGSDSNPCTFGSPCRSLQRAHDQTNASGEIDVLDPAGYGAVTIDRPISIVGHGFASVSPAAFADAITINAGPNDRINLRGLVIEGFGTGSNGIIFNAGASLSVQESIIRNFRLQGIQFKPTNASNAVLSHVDLDCCSDGLLVDGSFTTGGVKVVIADSVISNFSNNGIVNQSSNGGATQVMIRNCTISGNGTGILSSGLSAVVRVTRSTITANSTGVGTVAPATVISYGDNNLDNNTSNVVPTGPIAYH